ncbi:hypothetical protein Tco_1127665 [Tanacetum coccineum]
MTKSRNGGKRPREEAHDKPLESVSFIALSQHPPAFISGLTLSQHPPEQRKDFFLRKVNDVVRAKSLHPTDFEGYTIRERFAKMGWEQLLNFNCDKIYRRVVIQWTASLSRNGDELTGIVDGKSYTITPKNIRDLLEVDTCTDLPYSRFNEAYFQATTDENRERWLEACTTVFGTHENAKKTSEGFAHLMIDDIWDMYEQEQRNAIPHGCYISEILNRLGAVSNDEYVEVISHECRIISTNSFFPYLIFSESPTEYIIDARRTGLRVTFPKKLKQGEVPCQPPPQFGLPPQIPKLQNLTNKQSSHNEKQNNVLITMITNLKKQMEGQALEAKRCEKEREKKAEEREK